MAIHDPFNIELAMEEIELGVSHLSCMVRTSIHCEIKEEGCSVYFSTYSKKKKNAVYEAILHKLVLKLIALICSRKKKKVHISSKTKIFPHLAPNICYPLEKKPPTIINTFYLQTVSIRKKIYI